MTTTMKQDTTLQAADTMTVEELIDLLLRVVEAADADHDEAMAAADEEPLYHVALADQVPAIMKRGLTTEHTLVDAQQADHLVRTVQAACPDTTPVVLKVALPPHLHALQVAATTVKTTRSDGTVTAVARPGVVPACYLRVLKAWHHDPNQARVGAGQPGGGQFTGEDGADLSPEEMRNKRRQHAVGALLTHPAVAPKLPKVVAERGRLAGAAGAMGGFMVGSRVGTELGLLGGGALGGPGGAVVGGLGGMLTGGALGALGGWQLGRGYHTVERR